MFFACMRQKRKEAKDLGEEKQHRHSGACTTKYTKVHGMKHYMCKTSHSPCCSRVLALNWRKRQKQETQ